MLSRCRKIQVTTVSEYYSKEVVLDIIATMVAHHRSAADVYDVVEDIPAADVVERKVGTWRRYSPFTDTFECDQCGYQVVDESFCTSFCPECGVVMRRIEDKGAVW